MNITEFFENDNLIIHKNIISLKEGYYIAKADEEVYKYIGSNSSKPFYALIHEEDVSHFWDAVNNISNRPQEVVVRICDYKSTYRYMLLVIRHNGRVFGDFKSVDIELMDLVSAYKYYGKVNSFEQSIWQSYENAGAREIGHFSNEYEIDSFTGVYTKKAVTKLTNKLLAESLGDVYIIMLDIDDFKGINDTYGHLIGDSILSETIRIMKEVIKDRGYIGRFGGDEFFIAFDNVKDEEELVIILKTIRKQIAWNCKTIIEDVDITLSIGISKFPDHGNTYEELIEIADKCLYIAKSKGKNRYVIYTPEIHGNLIALESFGNAETVTFAAKKAYGLFTETYNNINAYKSGTISIEDLLKAACDEFRIDGIRIYTECGAKCSNAYGMYKCDQVEMTVLFDKATEELYDDNGTIFGNKLAFLKERSPKLYDNMSLQGITNFIIVKSDDKVILFEVFERLRKWSETDRGIMWFFGKLLLELI